MSGGSTVLCVSGGALCNYLRRAAPFTAEILITVVHEPEPVLMLQPQTSFGQTNTGGAPKIQSREAHFFCERTLGG